MQRRFFTALTGLVLAFAVSCVQVAQAKEQLQFGDVSAQTTDTGARIVFKWNSNSNVSFSPETRNNKVLLHFDSPVALEWGETLGNLKPYLTQVETTNGGKTVVLTLDSASQARKFLMYSRKGVDFATNGIELNHIQQPPASKAPVTTIASFSTPKKLVATGKKTIPQTIAKNVTKPATITPAAIAASDASLAELKPAAGKSLSEPAPQQPVAAPAPAAVLPAQSTATTERTLAALSPAAGEATPPTAMPEPVAAPAPTAATSEPVSPSTKEPKRTEAPAPVVKTDPAHEEASAEPKTEPAAPPVEGETIALPLLADDALSLIIRNQSVWLAADETAHMTEANFKKENPTLKRSVQAIPAKQGTVLAIALDGYVDAAIQKQPDGKIELLLTKQNSKPANSLLATLSTQDGKTSLDVDAPKAGKIITATDPASGETLHIVPVSAIGSGVDVTRSLVEFSLLPTAQGVAVQQISDNLKVTLTKDTLDISAPNGLTVSPEMKQALEEAKAGAAAGKIPPVFYPYGLWKLDDEKKFVPTQVKLFHASLSDNSTDANNARLKLLGLYLAEGMFAEANGMANDILRNSYKFYIEHKIAAMRGAANFFRFRFAEAAEDFSSPELEGLPETKMWLTLCNELLGRDKSAFNFASGYESYIRYYPPSFIQKLAIIAADKSIGRKEYDAATAIFTTLQKENIDEPVKKYIDFMRAKILSETGNDDEAAKIWERQASDVTDRLIRARSEFSLVNMYLKEDKIPVEDATKRLEKLRIVWRGDAIELNVLTLLGNLYVEQKDFAKALRAWRDIVAYYSEVPEAIVTAQKMEEVFVKLYNKNGADTMPPLAALSLFYEFRDLVPTGSDGDLMIRNLAERLVKIDLLDRASQLLNHQIRNRLQGTERSRVGTRLAEIYLMNRQPKQALETLKTTGYGDLPPDIQLSRIRLTAQALAQQGQLSKAIDVLSSDTSAEGNLLRLTVYWTNWDWPNVVAMAEEILSNRNDPSAALTLQESEVLLKLATAYVYEHDSGQIQYLRDYFTPLLKGNPNKDSFLFITSESGSIDYGNLSNLDKDIKTVKGFIDTSRSAAKRKSSAESKGAPMASTAEPKKTVN